MKNTKTKIAHHTLPERLRAATKPPMIQIAPGRYAPEPAADGLPEMCLARFVADGKDAMGREHFKLVPVLENMVRLDSRVLRLIGMTGQCHTLERLGRAGFIEMVRVAPRTTLLNLDSWYNHVRRCAEDGEEFWNQKRTDEYRKAI